ncbi:MAG: hypothetical protein P1V20_05805, partial [Verrucomicrobiales bacterium]|nr:hypothetical protein [Verrucomicrobiales bacterium]
MSADREIKALHRQTQRSVSAVPAYDAPARVKMAAAVAKTRRIVAPLTPVREPVVEPPIPESDPGEFAEEVPVPPLTLGRQARLTEAEKAVGVAKTYYLRGLWEAAAEWYLKALDWDPSSYDAAEGFVMSAFHSGHYNYAYRMGEDISTTIPGVKQEVVRAANDEIELLLKNGRVAEAGELLNQFPLEEKAFQAARQKVG